MKHITLSTELIKASTERDEITENVNKNKQQLMTHTSIDIEVITSTDLIESTIANRLQKYTLPTNSTNTTKPTKRSRPTKNSTTKVRKNKKHKTQSEDEESDDNDEEDDDDDDDDEEEDDDEESSSSDSDDSSHRTKKLIKESEIDSKLVKAITAKVIQSLHLEVGMKSRHDINKTDLKERMVNVARYIQSEAYNIAVGGEQLHAIKPSIDISTCNHTAALLRRCWVKPTGKTKKKKGGKRK
jgi:hypothetical protein